MAKRISKKSQRKSIKSFFGRFRKWPSSNSDRVRLHKSFRRSYREDYKRELNVPGITHHIFATFKIIFQNWKLFLPFMLILVFLNIVLVGIMSEDTYKQFQGILDQTNAKFEGVEIGTVARAGLLLLSTITTGGLAGDSGEATSVFMVIIFLITWLVTIYLLRHRLAEHKIKLRDGLYNGLTPLISTLIVFLVALVQCVPLFLLIIVYSAAVKTEFLATPFYALVFFIFALVMIVLSGYLLSSSLIALVAVSAPGLYPLKALHTASDLMAGRRIRFILRILALIFALGLMWVIIMIPLIIFDLFMKQFEWTAGIPFVSICLLIMTCFSCIFITTYLYLYYRWLLKN